MNQPPVYEIANWRDTSTSTLAVPVSRILKEMRQYLGELPDTLGSEKAVQTFADACSIPLAAADIEGDLFFPNRRFASRQFVRDQYPDFVLWCMENGWLDGSESAKLEGSESAKPSEPKAALIG